MTAEDYYQEGERLYEAEDYEAAGAAYQKATELDDGYVDAWVGRASACWRLGRLEESKGYCEQALDVDEGDAWAWHRLGAVYYDLKDYDKAIEAFRKAIELDPDYAAPWNGLGIVYDDLKDYDKAIEAYRKAIELDPENAIPWNGLGNVYDDLKDYDKAIEAFRKAIELDPDYATPWNGLGNVYANLKDYDKAIEAFRKAIELDPDYAAPWNGLGNVYKDLKDYDKAIEAYRKAIELDPENATPWYGLGNVYDDLKDYDKAIEAFRKAIELDPNSAYPWNGLGIVYDNLQEGSQAARCFIRAESLGQVVVAYNCFVVFSKLQTHPFFSHRIIRTYMPESQYLRWSKYFQTTLENSTPLHAYITWQSLTQKKPLGSKAQWQLWLGIIHYFMGDPSVALRYLNQSQSEKEGLDLMIAYYQLQACYDFHEPEAPYLEPALEIAATYLQPKPTFWQRLSGGAQRLDTEGVLQCYYAGQLFVFTEEYEKALICFERVEEQYLPAAYMAVWVCRVLKNYDRRTKKVKALLKREAKEQRFTEGLSTVYLDLDEPQFWKPFFHVAQYFELTEGIADFRYAAKGVKTGKKLRIANPKAQPYYHQLWKIRPEDQQRINDKILEELNYRTFDQLFEDKLQPTVQSAPKLTKKIVDKRLDQYEDTELRAAFERLLRMAEAGKAEQGLGELIKAGQFEVEQYQLFNAFFFSEAQLSDYERIMLDFYMLLTHQDTEKQLTDSQSSVIKTGAGAVISDSLSYAIGFGASLAVPGLPPVAVPFTGALSGYAVKMAAGALTEQLMKFLEEERPTFESYADFKAQFEQHIGRERRELGEGAFFERYPIGVLYGGPKE